MECKNCGKDTTHDKLTFCSDICLYESIKNSKSVGDIPMENWDLDPWV